jgi:DNA-binding NarL/FixJ family response regulator
MDEDLCDVVNEENKKVDRKNINLVIIDNSATLYENYVSSLCELYFKDYSVKVKGYEILDDGLNNLNGDKNTIVLCGVEGNATQVSLYGKDSSWAGKYHDNIALLINDIKAKKPSSKLVIFTAGQKYSIKDLESYGADGYISKFSTILEVRDELNRVLSNIHTESYK